MEHADYYEQHLGPKGNCDWAKVWIFVETTALEITNSVTGQKIYITRSAILDLRDMLNQLPLDIHPVST